MDTNQRSNSLDQEYSLQTKDTYNSVAHKFAETRCGKGQWEEFVFLNPYILEGARLLDLGCGSGRLAQYIEKEHMKINKYVGVDYSKNLLHEAKNRVSTLHFETDFIAASMTEVGELFDKRTFDVAFCIASFHHLLDEEERIKTLNGIADCLKSGGTLVMVNWNIASETRKKGIKAVDHDNFYVPFTLGEKTYGRVYHQFLPKELDALLEKAGFTQYEHFSVKDGVRCGDPSQGANIITIATTGSYTD